MYDDLKGKTAIVTGSSKGIGRAVAERFGSEGMNVVVNYHGDEDGATEAAEKIRQAGGKAIVIQADVSKKEDVQKLLKAAVDEYGSMDVMVNNSGFSKPAPLHEMDEEDWRSVIDVNLTGTFLGGQAALRYMLENDIQGSIINMSSVHQQIPKPSDSHYAASKGGIKLLTETMALEYADKGIRVNAIAPGTIATDRNDDTKPENETKQMKKIPMQTFGKPEEIAAAAAWLASREASYVTGTTLFVDGGMTLYPSQLEL
ncbi:glucose 1-dehydrogenase [Terribacillus aidingensis]|uniref:Glucose 1-dehydrogenase n=1 Tax=Terribacillus aidingensis TaxID=586416 RepID=A0A285P6N0_9BACI|nr:glucose 1-dehydrogenase [Terribacillus aidingensis]SNZ17108.1 glucose 1-dehydrogenase [Terribacillus aidingensis]